MQKFEEREWVVLENQGQKIFGVLHRPLHAELKIDKVPAIVVCHGFAGVKAGRYRMYVLMAEQLARLGIATLRIDFRGSGDSEGYLSQMTLTGEVSDAIKGLEFLASHPHIDTERLGILGKSLGAAVAVMAASQYKKLKSMALWVPVFSASQWKGIEEVLKNTTMNELVLEQMTRLTDGNLPGIDFMHEMAQLNVEQDLLSLQSLPLLHIQSANDAKVKADQGEHYRRCRQNASGESHFIVVPKSDHEFSHPQERCNVIEETALWFAKTL